MAEETLREEFETWGGGTKTKSARPANVGPHDRADDQHDPNAKGVTPEDYKVNPADSVAKAPPGESGEEANVNVAARNHTGDQTGNKPQGKSESPRSAPPLSGTAQE
ncbi:hypothetical protein [Roseomonas elaeocarpi]|uniref:Uncharacterized protein n=1 Tax=Roseomonas elaeocarpi TaxID=907779 RepID=A0ABV6JW30_9PROT